MTNTQAPDARERLTDGFNRARLALETRRSLTPLLVITIGVLLSLGAWFTIIKNVGRQVYADNSDVGFEVSNASAVIGGGRQEVRFKGVPAGVIQSIELKNGHPFIKAKIYKSYLPIYRDARANLRPSTALEDMYLDIVNRGTPAAGKASLANPIPSQNVRTGIQVEDIMQSLDSDVRGHLAIVLDQLGRGLHDRGASLREAFVQVAPLLETAGRLSDQLVHRQAAVRTLVTNTAVISDELARRQRSLRALVADSGATLKTLQNGSADLDATLRGLPPTLQAADTSFASVRATLPDLDQALLGLRAVADRLPAGLLAARQISSDAQPALAKLQPTVPALSLLAKYLAPGALGLDQTTHRLLPQIPAIAHAVRTTAGCSAAIQGFFQWTPSVMKLGDARGAVVRGQAVVGLASTGAVKDPMVIPRGSCAPGTPVGGVPGPGGTRMLKGASR